MNVGPFRVQELKHVDLTVRRGERGAVREAGRGSRNLRQFALDPGAVSGDDLTEKRADFRYGWIARRHDGWRREHTRSGFTLDSSRRGRGIPQGSRSAYTYLV